MKIRKVESYVEYNHVIKKEMMTIHVYVDNELYQVRFDNHNMKESEKALIDMALYLGNLDEKR